MERKEIDVQRVRVGTCGWSYQDDWKGVFYPDWLNERYFLEYYAEIFNTNEIDSSFYHTPQKAFVVQWDQKTNTNFLFSAKLPQDFTHKMKIDLVEGKKFLINHLDAFEPLEKSGKMLAHLLQLPPRFSIEEWGKLESFLNFWNTWRETEGKSMLGGKLNSYNWRLVIEFRNLSWMTERTFELLRKYNTAYCAVIEPTLPPRMDITAPDLFYIRFHGYGKKIWFDYLFSDQELDHWALELNDIIKMNPKTKVGIYFNNHFSGNAVKNARDIVPRLGLKPIPDFDKVGQKFKSSIIKKKKSIDMNTSLDQFFTKKKRLRSS